MKNHSSDFESPFGSIVPVGSGAALASCKFCEWIKRTEVNARKRWSPASRARMGLQLHALAKHPEETKGMATVKHGEGNG
jgi:hypothetical protein